MSITIPDIVITPLALPLKKPYLWSQGVLNHFTVDLVEVIASDVNFIYVLISKAFKKSEKESRTGQEQLSTTLPANHLSKVSPVFWQPLIDGCAVHTQPTPGLQHQDSDELPASLQ